MSWCHTVVSNPTLSSFSPPLQVHDFVLDDVSSGELTKELHKKIAELTKVDKKIARAKKGLVGLETLLEKYEVTVRTCMSRGYCHAGEL